MKNLILLLVLFIPLSLIAQITQDKTEAKSLVMSDQTNEWMTKISSDSEMRSKIIGMMIDKTKGNEEEMTKLVNALMDSPAMHKIMLAKHPVNAENKNISLEPRKMKNDNVKEMRMYKTAPVPKK